MPQRHPHPAANTRCSADKRDFLRYPVRLNALVTSLTGAPPNRCEIRDLCLGGMLLNYAQDAARNLLPDVGEQVDVRCAVPGSPHRRLFRFRARIVRTDGESAGVVLVNPDLNALHLLLDYAVSQQPGKIADAAAHEAASCPADAPDTDSRRRLLAACHAMAGEIVDPLMESFIAHAGGQLLNSADHARNTIEQNAYFDSLGIINRSHESILKNFKSAYKEWSAASPSRAGPTMKTTSAPAPAKLSLVEEDALNDWLAVSDIANHVESRRHMELAELEQRLTYLYGTDIGKENNPFGPYAFAQSFNHALKPLELQQIAGQICYSVFKTQLMEQLGDLLIRLNAYLAGNGVLPDIKFGTAQNCEENSASRRNITDCAVEPTPRDLRAGEAGAVAPPRETNTAEKQDLYGIVRDLFSLRRQFGYHPDGLTADLELEPGTASGADAAACDRAQTELFTTEEVVAALSEMQAKHSSNAEIRHGENGFHSKVLSAIHSHSALGGAEKRIGNRESSILYVGGNLFESLFRDMLLDTSVRAWLQRLEIPLLKRAVLDESLFVDKGHVARQVVNKIAQLELYGEESENGENAIQRQVNSLLNRIASEIDADPEIFSRALKKLDSLIQIQDLAFAENVQDVISDCENEQQNLAHRPAQPATGSVDDPCDAEYREWRKRASRLKPGSWVLFSSDHPLETRRLKLAWISKDLGRYVFVNLRGLKESVLDIHQLSERLRAGTAVVLDSAEEPAMDRAQYSMLQNLHQQLLFETTHDQLTGLVNRREFERLLTVKVHEARLTNVVHSLLYIDIDQFNVVNVTCGYDAGDNLLLEIAELLKGVTDKGMTLARIGADEFCLLLENRPMAEALGVAEAQIGVMRDYRFTWGDRRFSPSCCIGLAPLDRSCANAADILQAAESSCRAAKQQGVNRIEVHNPGNAVLCNEQQTMKWIARIDKALEKGELDLRYQSIVPLTGCDPERPHHVEVLLGVSDDEGNPISPQELIVTAEHYHRMPAIDRWVIRTAFQWMGAHKSIVEEIGGLAINLSGRSLGDESLKDFILAEMNRTGAPMDRICFEVTETAGIDNLTDAAEFILDMKKSGCTFALDDFGSGLSSYAYLKKLPVDYLKIDGAFVKEMDRNPSDYAVVKSISEIAHFMGKKVIAEYVENEAIMSLLREIGVDFAQGYVIDKPRRLFDLTGRLGGMAQQAPGNA